MTPAITRFLAYLTVAACCIAITFMLLGMFPSLKTREFLGLRLDILLAIWIGIPVATGLKNCLAKRRAKQGPAL